MFTLSWHFTKQPFSSVSITAVNKVGLYLLKGKITVKRAEKMIKSKLFALRSLYCGCAAIDHFIDQNHSNKDTCQSIDKKIPNIVSGILASLVNFI